MAENNYDGISLYVHIPFCTGKCRYCNFYSEPVSFHDTSAFADAIVKELDSRQIDMPVETIYIGGGTPQTLGREVLTSLAGHLSGRFSPMEFTVEINPGGMDRRFLENLYGSGVNRLSVGAQSFNQAYLDFLGRNHSVNDIYETVNAAHSAGFDNIGLDLIFAIPRMDLRSWQNSLSSAIELNVQHISAYSLSYEKSTPLYDELASGKTKAVNEQTDRAMYELAIDMLCTARFAQYEISNFAKCGFVCRHNFFFWQHRPYIGIGPAAASYGENRRTTNIADIKKYIGLVNAGQSPVAESSVLSPVETACETAVLSLRTMAGIDLGRFRSQTGFDALELFAEPVMRLTELGLLAIDKDSIHLARPALAIADSVLCEFSTV